jgi:hypothetical protein
MDRLDAAVWIWKGSCRHPSDQETRMSPSFR